MIKVICLKTGEEVEAESRDFAEMFIKVSVKWNNENAARLKQKRDNKRNYVIIEE